MTINEGEHHLVLNPKIICTVKFLHLMVPLWHLGTKCLQPSWQEALFLNPLAPQAFTVLYDA